MAGAGSFPLDPAELPLLPRISDYAFWHAERAAEAPAASDSRESWTYRDLAERVDRIARALIASGIDKGDRVALLAPPCTDFISIFLAAASIGAIWVGLNPKYQRDELRYVVGDCRPKLIFGWQEVQGRDYREDLAILAADAGAGDAILLHGASSTFEDFCERGDTIDDATLAARRAAVDARDACLIVYTSGSTGRPKGAMLHHEGLVIPWYDDRAQLEEGRPVAINYFPINHIACVGDVSATTLVMGGKIAFMEKFEADAMLRALGEQGVATWGGVPSIFEIAMRHPNFAATDFSSVRRIFWGGAAMPAPTVLALTKITPRFATNYGLTESCGPITATGDMIVDRPEDVDDVVLSVGAPTPSYRVRLRSDDGPIVDKPGIDGEIEALGRPLFLGYWNRPDATANAFTDDGWFRTGDIGSWLPDGRVRITGRRSEMFKSGGYNVYPREVEMLLESHPEVAEAAVIGVADATWGEVGVAYVLTTTTAEALIDHCRGGLANYKIPKRIIIVDDLPRLPVGKVDKMALRKQHSPAE